MKKGLRSAALLDIPLDLRNALIAVRNTLGISGPAEVPLADVVGLEKHLGGKVPDEIIAILIATGRSIGELSNHTAALASYYEGNERAWRRRFKFHHAAIDDTFNPDEGFLCVELQDAKTMAPAKLAFWFCRKGAAFDAFAEEGEPPLVAYLLWRYPNADFTKPVDGALLQPAIVAPAKAKERRVTHPKFGEGVVLQIIAPDKLEIDFGAHGVRKLLAATVSG